MKNAQLSTKDTLTGTFPAVSPVNFPKILEENVGNFCPVCGKTIFSNLLEIDGKVYLEKNCCVKELVFLENDVDFFQKHRRCSEIKPFISNPKNIDEFVSKGPSHPLMALYAITTRCNMDCPICFLKFGKKFKHKNWDLPIAALKQAVKKYKAGGEISIQSAEPTMREDLPEIIKTIKNNGTIPGIVTNGLKLKDINYVKKLKKAGLKSITVQFDGFSRAANIRFRGKDYLDIKLKALENIKKVGGFRVQLAAVIEKEVNEIEMPNIVQFALENKFIDRITFFGLSSPPNSQYKETAYSDLVKIMEKYGYMDKEYFSEMVKMNRNIHEVIRKMFRGAQLENWILKKLPDNFNTSYLLKKKANPPKFLFQKSDIQKINAILVEVMSKNNKAATSISLLKNSLKLINSPLWRIAMGRISLLSKRPPNTLGTLEIFLRKLEGPYTNHILKGKRTTDWTGLNTLMLFSSNFGPIFAEG